MGLFPHRKTFRNFPWASGLTQSKFGTRKGLWKQSQLQGLCFCWGEDQWKCWGFLQKAWDNNSGACGASHKNKSHHVQEAWRQLNTFTFMQEACPIWHALRYVFSWNIEASPVVFCGTSPTTWISWWQLIYKYTRVALYTHNPWLYLIEYFASFNIFQYSHSLFLVSNMMGVQTNRCKMGCW